MTYGGLVRLMKMASKRKARGYIPGCELTSTAVSRANISLRSTVDLGDKQ